MYLVSIQGGVFAIHLLVYLNSLVLFISEQNPHCMNTAQYGMYYGVLPASLSKLLCATSS